MLDAKSNSPMLTWLKVFGSLDAHHRFFWAAFLSAIVGGLSAGKVPLSNLPIVVWNVFAATTIALCWLKMTLADARTSVREAKLQDSGRSAIFLFVVFACLAALISGALLLTTMKGKDEAHKGASALFALTTVLLSWLTIHTVFALHYTHRFYRGEKGPKSPKDHGGLTFPDDPHPGFLDFAYFGFVIGMTCQVSDVQITSKSMRRLALWHGLLSFVFNTVILALTVNLSSSLVAS